MNIIESYLMYLNEVNTSVVVPLTIGATMSSIQIAKMIDINLKRKKCIQIAKRFNDKNKRNAALVRCYQSGGD